MGMPENQIPLCDDNFLEVETILFDHKAESNIQKYKKISMLGIIKSKLEQLKEVDCSQKNKN